MIFLFYWKRNNYLTYYSLPNTFFWSHYERIVRSRSFGTSSSRKTKTYALTCDPMLTLRTIPSYYHRAAQLEKIRKHLPITKKQLTHMQLFFGLHMVKNTITKLQQFWYEFAEQILNSHIYKCAKYATFTKRFWMTSKKFELLSMDLYLLKDARTAFNYIYNIFGATNSLSDIFL